MGSRSEKEGIRPALKLTAGAFAVGLALAGWLVLGGDGGGDDGTGDGSVGSAVHRSGGRGAGTRLGRTGRGARGRWSTGGGAGPDTGVTRGARPREQRPDPQLVASHRSFGGADAGVVPHIWPMTQSARLTSVEGDVPFQAGTSCEVRTLPVRAGRFNCLIRVMCDGMVVYPEARQQAGYVSCDVENGAAVRAVDDGITSADGDPTVHFDAESRRVVVTDDGPGVRAFRAELSLGPSERMRM